MEKIGLSLGTEKTEIFKVVKDGTVEVYHLKDKLLPSRKFEESFEKVEGAVSMRYLGSRIGSTKAEVISRIDKANMRFNQLHQAVWRRDNLSFKTSKIFKAAVLSILFYGLKCHAVSRLLMRKLICFCLNNLKVILGFLFDGHISYDRISVEQKFLISSGSTRKRTKLQER